jgi:CheY-like chemotaxis protein
MAIVLLVMKRPGNIRIMAQVLEANGHVAVSAPDHDSLNKALDQPDGNRIAVVDASGFRTSDWRMCQTLQQNGVRFIVLCAPHEASKGGQALLSGASSFLMKPVGKPMLLRLLVNLAEQNNGNMSQRA